MGTFKIKNNIQCRFLLRDPKSYDDEIARLVIVKYERGELRLFVSLRCDLRHGSLQLFGSLLVVMLDT